jgi:hypothetical protein
MNPTPRLHTTRHICDLAPEGRELAFYLVAKHPYAWEAYEGRDLVAHGTAKTRVGLSLAVGNAGRKWIRAHHLAES